MFVTIKESFSKCEPERGANQVNEKKNSFRSNLLRFFDKLTLVEKAIDNVFFSHFLFLAYWACTSRKGCCRWKIKVEIAQSFLLYVRRLRWCLEPLPFLPDLRTKWIGSRLKQQLFYMQINHSSRYCWLSYPCEQAISCNLCMNAMLLPAQFSRICHCCWQPLRCQDLRFLLFKFNRWTLITICFDRDHFNPSHIIWPARKWKVCTLHTAYLNSTQCQSVNKIYTFLNRILSADTTYRERIKCNVHFLREFRRPGTIK